MSNRPAIHASFLAQHTGEEHYTTPPHDEVPGFEPSRAAAAADSIGTATPPTQAPVSMLAAFLPQWVYRHLAELPPPSGGPHPRAATLLRATDAALSRAPPHAWLSRPPPIAASAGDRAPAATLD